MTIARMNVIIKASTTTSVSQSGMMNEVVAQQKKLDN